jgi:phage gp37-like protein
MAVMRPYFDRLQDYVGVNLRAIDAVARRVDDSSVAQLRMMGAVRADLIDFAHHVDERVDD